MAFLQDHLISVIIGSIVMLMLFQIHLDGQEASVEITSHYSGYTHALSFVETLQHDFPNIGAGVNPANPMIVDYVWNATTKYIEFRGTIGTAATAPIEQIRYQVVFVDSAEINFNDSLQTVALFEVQRLVDDSGTYKITGSSTQTIREFEVSLFDGSGLAVGGAFDDTRQIEVHMVMVPPLAGKQVNRHNYFHTRFRPPSLTLKDP